MQILTILALFLFLLIGVSPAQDAGTTGIANCPDFEARATPMQGKTISVADTELSYKKVTGRLTIMAGNVRLRCLQVDASGDVYGMNCFVSGGCPGLIAEDIEVFNARSSTVNLLGKPGNPAILRRAHLHSTEQDLLKMNGWATVEASYLHGFTPSPGAHNDAIQTTGGDDIIIRGNVIEGPPNAQTSAYILKTDQASSHNIRIEHNRLSGGSYTLYVRKGKNFPTPTGVRVMHNVFVRGTAQFGPVDTEKTGAACIQWGGNQWDDGERIGNPTRSICQFARPTGLRLPR